MCLASFIHPADIGAVIKREATMKLKYVRNGHKSAVAKLIEGFTQIQEATTTTERIDPDSVNEVTRIKETLENRIHIIEELNSKILDELKDEKEIEEEICETTDSRPPISRYFSELRFA